MTSEFEKSMQEGIDSLKHRNLMGGIAEAFGRASLNSLLNTGVEWDDIDEEVREWVIQDFGKLLASVDVACRSVTRN